MSRFAKKLNMLNCESSTGNCVHYMHRMTGLAEKIEYPKLLIFKRKLCTLYMYRMYGVAEKLNVQNFINLTGNCTHKMFGMSGFAEKLNIQNYKNLTGNCVHYM